jgi:heavy metal sensor kinase
MRSLRARLVVWSSALLVAALTAVGAWVVVSTHAAWLASVDRVLETHGDTLGAAIEPAGDGAVDVVVPAALTRDARDVYAVWDVNGRLVIASDGALPDHAPAVGIRSEDGLRVAVTQAAGGATLLVGRRIDDLAEELRRLTGTLALVGAAALVLVVAGGWWLVGRALTPVATISQTARAMIDGDLTARIPTGRIESELEELAGVLNEAFDRLYASIERQRRFTADASHDLRTPLATLQAETQWALARPRSRDEYLTSIEVCQRAVTRMNALAQSLLDLTRAESQDVSLRQSCVLAEVIDAVIEELGPLAAQRHVTLQVHDLSGTVHADPHGLRAAVTNLLTNAIQYNVDGGRVEVHTTVEAGAVSLSVSDTGLGLAEDQRSRVFDRFYRVDPSRAGGGAGLGLAMVSVFAQAHGGSVRVDSAPGRGSTFTLTLPHNETPAVSV